MTLQLKKTALVVAVSCSYFIGFAGSHAFAQRSSDPDILPRLPAGPPRPAPVPKDPNVTSSILYTAIKAVRERRRQSNMARPYRLPRPYRLFNCTPWPELETSSRTEFLNEVAGSVENWRLEFPVLGFDKSFTEASISSLEQSIVTHLDATTGGKEKTRRIELSVNIFKSKIKRHVVSKGIRSSNFYFSEECGGTPPPDVVFVKVAAPAASGVFIMSQFQAALCLHLGRSLTETADKNKACAYWNQINLSPMAVLNAGNYTYLVEWRDRSTKSNNIKIQLQGSVGTEKKPLLIEFKK